MAARDQLRTGTDDPPMDLKSKLVSMNVGGIVIFALLALVILNVVFKGYVI